MELLSKVRRTLAAGLPTARDGALAGLAACAITAGLSAGMPAAGNAATPPVNAEAAPAAPAARAEPAARSVAADAGASGELAKLLSRVAHASARHRPVRPEVYARIHVLARRVESDEHPPPTRCRAALRRALGLEKEKAHAARLLADSRSAKKGLSTCAVKPPQAAAAPVTEIHDPQPPTEAGDHLWVSPMPGTPPPVVNPKPPHHLKPPGAVLEGYEAESHSSGKGTFGEAQLPVVGDVKRTSKATPTATTEYAACTRKEKSSECLIALKAPIAWSLVEEIHTEPASQTCKPTSNKISGQESNAVVGLLDLSYGAGDELLGGELVPVGAPIFSIGEAPLRGLPLGTECGYWKMTEAQEKEAPKVEPKLLTAAQLEGGEPIEEVLDERPPGGQVSVTSVPNGSFTYEFKSHIRVRFIPGSPGAPIPGAAGEGGT